MFTSITGQRSVIAILISTLAIAGVVNPLHLRAQTIIDRRFYHNFAVDLRNQVHLEQISDKLVDFVQEIYQPELLSLWLIKNNKPKNS